MLSLLLYCLYIYTFLFNFFFIYFLVILIEKTYFLLSQFLFLFKFIIELFVLYFFVFIISECFTFSLSLKLYNLPFHFNVEYSVCVYNTVFSFCSLTFHRFKFNSFGINELFSIKHRADSNILFQNCYSILNCCSVNPGPN